MTYSIEASPSFIPAAGREVSRFDDGQSIIERWEDMSAGVWCYMVRDEGTGDSYPLYAEQAAEFGLPI